LFYGIGLYFVVASASIGSINGLMRAAALRGGSSGGHGRSGISYKEMDLPVLLRSSFAQQLLKVERQTSSTLG